VPTYCQVDLYKISSNHAPMVKIDHTLVDYLELQRLLGLNRLNQTEPATFLIMPCWAFFRDSYFLYFKHFADKFLEWVSSLT
jgi:hypothetical protein